MINFSDCEGTLTHKACEKLAKDFEDFQSICDNEEDSYFVDDYVLWRNAFKEAAKNNGVINFQ